MTATEQLETPLGDGGGAGAGGALARLLRSWRLAGIFIPFVILFVVLSIASSPFLHTANLINILDQQAVLAAAFSETSDPQGVR